ncbi:hypothetical protein ABIE21_001583 [Conyzicola nivalis]|uniref:PH domain-containing protein n=1 Tax=Conyzicola nivalis TaxID=1477021 RepID=A0ABV2QMH4_9MICO
MQTATPSTANYRKSVLVGCGLAALFVVIALGRMEGGALTAGIVVIALVFGCVLLGIWLYFRNTRVDYEPGRVVRFDLLGRPRELTTAAVEAVVLVERLRDGTQTVAPALFMLDSAGRTQLRLRGGLWSIDDLGAIGASIPREPVSIAGDISAGQLRLRYPAAVSFWEAHAVAASLVAALMIVVAAALLSLVLA